MTDIEDLKKYGHRIGRILRRQHTFYFNTEESISEFADEPLYDNDEVVGDLVIEFNNLD